MTRVLTGVTGFPPRPRQCFPESTSMSVGMLAVYLFAASGMATGALAVANGGTQQGIGAIILAGLAIVATIYRTWIGHQVARSKGQAELEQMRIDSLAERELIESNQALRVEVSRLLNENAALRFELAGLKSDLRRARGRQAGEPH